MSKKTFLQIFVGWLFWRCSVQVMHKLSLPSPTQPRSGGLGKQSLSFRGTPSLPSGSLHPDLGTEPGCRQRHAPRCEPPRTHRAGLEQTQRMDPFALNLSLSAN